MRFVSFIVVPFLLQLMSAGDAEAQIRASERGSVAQTIDGTVFTIDFARPRVRGREPVFGRVVTTGETWTPGANWATTLEVSRDVQIEGHPVPKGKYSMWMVVGAQEWTLLLDPRNKRYHTEVPDSTAAQIRLVVHPEEGTFTEALTWSFPEVTSSGTVLQLQWGTKRVTLRAKVTPKFPLAIARADVERYLGRYQWWFTDPDSVNKTIVELYYEDGSLKARYEPRPDFYPSIQRGVMARINDDWFIPVIQKNGEIEEMVSDFIFEFTVAAGKVTGFEIFDDQENLMAKGVRIGTR